jgi:Flp pilus assembly protein CpaB
MSTQGLVHRSRGVAVGTALVLAVVATVAVFLYVQGVRKDARTSPIANMQTVIVPKEDIPAGTSLDALISQGAFTTVQVPRDALVQGVVTDLTQIRGRTTSAAVLAGEQITTARLQGSTARTGGILGIRDGYQAVTISLAVAQAGGGFVRSGDHVTIYASLDNVSLIRGKLRDFLKGGGASNTKQNIGDFTVTLAPDVRVLRVVGGDTQDRQSSNDQIQLSLELHPVDAAMVVFAQEHGSIWMSLLAPGQPGSSTLPVDVGDLLANSLIPSRA